MTLKCLSALFCLCFVQALSKQTVLSPPPEETTPSSSDTTHSSPDHLGDSPTQTGNSLAEPVVNKGGESPTPIAPPRRKRRTKRAKAEHQHATTVSPVTVNILHDPRKPRKQNGILKSPTDNFVDLEDPLLEDLVRDNSTAGSCTSGASLAVMGSSSRPHSVLTPSTYQNDGFGFVAEDRGSTTYSSMPRVLATTWSPRSKLLDKKRSVLPASSECLCLLACVRLVNVCLRCLHFS